ncbi:TRAP transporter large permease [Sphingomonas psychrotolerans]|uniref:TRAP transporter large permease protein n=1 Tax=Sphingomonas psychrotolerans TaxID=1327635 RepID=A0ABU3N6V7_9SPHN|nr:TRAP transporter large permease [Sphingomonas psychrotolerans]MDT8759196.1 TRAP transporter large permease [Sphingomonas psychrotolerans]
MIASPEIGLIGVVLLLVLLLCGLRIGAALGLVGLGGLMVTLGVEPALIKAGVVVIDVLTKYELGTLPLFLLMAQLFFAANASRDLFDAAAKFLGHRRGGLAYAAVAGCAGFGTINGSSLATAATVGMVALPEMRQRGYADTLATGSVAAGGTLGQMIPPSGALIVFGIIAEQSIGTLFTAAIIPGITQMLLYMAVIWIVVRLHPELGPTSERASWAERFRALARIWDMMLMIALVIGGIAVGWVSPSEAAAIGATGAFAVAAIRRRLSLAMLKNAFASTLETSGLILLVIIGALIFSVFVSVTGLPDALGAAVRALDLGSFGTLLLIAAFLLLLGSVLDGLALMLLTTPILLPIVGAAGMTPIWFGIFLTRAMEIGFVHPPLGMNLYVIQGVAKDVPINRIFKGVLPFLASDFLHLLLLILFPALILWLPGWIGK